MRTLEIRERWSVRQQRVTGYEVATSDGQLVPVATLAAAVLLARRLCARHGYVPVD